MTQQDAMRLVVPPSEWEEFERYLNATNLKRIRAIHQTWNHNKIVDERKRANRG